MAVAAGAAALLSDQNRWAAALVAVGVLLPVAAFLADRAGERSGDLDIEKVADRLADLVRDDWDKEATRRGVGRPPLEVFWEAAASDLVHAWPELLQQAAGGRSGPASAAPGSGPNDLAGRGALLAAYDRTPCGRLVVLGEPGAGKTVLLLRLVLDLLGRRQPGQPVPLLIPLSSWDPSGPSLYAWIETQILREYPHLATVDTATGRKRAGALLDAGLILPVLDGFDEIRTGSRDQALAAINESLRSNVGLILSCRPEELRAAVRPDPDVRPIHIDGAAGIQLKPLGPETVRAYLLAGAGNDGPGRWAQTLHALADPGSPVTQTLTTPLAASLANTIYNPRPRESTVGLPSPTHLAALPTAAAIEQHLLAGFVPAAYRTHPDQPIRWTIDQAAPYLTFLAHHLEHRLRTTGLAWWALPRSTPRMYRGLVIGLAAGLAAGLLVGLLTKPLTGLVGGLADGLVVGLALGSRGSRPSHVALRRLLLADVAVGLAAGLAVGLATGLGFGLVVGLGFGLMSGIATVLVRLGLGAATDTRQAADPKTVLTRDRLSALLVAIMVGLGFGFVGVLVFGLTGGIAAGAPAGVAAGLASAWGQLGLTRLWLATRRQQPLHLIAFLEDAHARGVLRQAGAVWEFRHASLQRYLAGPP